MIRDMLIVLGGFLGSGRSLLARMLATETGFHYHSFHEKKMRHLVRDERNMEKVRTIQPNTDELRMRICEEMLNDFPMLSKMHDNVIVEDVLHRKIPREFFLKEAKRYFDPVVFVWIETPDDTTEARLKAMEKKGIIPSVSVALQRRTFVMKEFQPFESLPLIFFHKKTDARAAKKLNVFIQHCLKRKLIAD